MLQLRADRIKARAQGACNVAARPRFRCKVQASAAADGPRCVVGTLRGGVPKFGDKAHCGVVPVLNPLTSTLPFSCSLQFVCSCTHDDEGPQALMHARRDVVELVYVLSGEGHLEAPDGTQWPVHPGVSAILFANSTRLVAAPDGHEHAEPSTSSASTSDPLAVLKFHLPLSLLHGEESGQWGQSDLQPRELEALLQLSMPAAITRGVMGVLPEEDALRLLNAAHTRTHASMDAIHSPPPAVLSNVVVPTPARAPSPPPFSVDDDQPSAHGWTLPTHILAAAVGGATHTVQRLLSALPSAVSSATSVAATAATVAATAAKRAAAVPAILQGLGGWRTGLHQGGASSHLQQQIVSGLHALDHVHVHSHASTAVHRSPAAAAAAGILSPSMLSSSSDQSGCLLMKRAIEEFKAFRFPKQTNQLAFVFDPTELGLSLSFGVEVFEPGHHTPLHVHQTGHELFFVLAGEGDAYCDGHHIPVRAGDCIVFPPGTLHGLDNNTGSKLYTLQMMCPDDEFVSYVQSGEHVGRLNDEDICQLTSNRC